jgi:hypothetical protein
LHFWRTASGISTAAAHSPMLERPEEFDGHLVEIVGKLEANGAPE